ncbi:MAG: hypothetical protein ACREOO_09315 [bacterium]
MSSQVEPRIQLAEVVANGGHEVAGVAASSRLQRVAFSDGMQRPPLELVERYEKVLDIYAAKLLDRVNLNMKNSGAVIAQELGHQPKLGEPLSGPFYKWWDVFVVGPFQNITRPPFLPQKVVAAGEPAFFLVFVVKNPLPTPGSGPSALMLMNGRPFNLRAEMVNLSDVSDGPDIVLCSAFNTDMVQAFLLVFAAPVPPQGKPDMYEVNVTVDVTDAFLQPTAAFATRLLDIDNDPGFPVGCSSGTRTCVEQPMRFLCYKP